MKTSLVVPCVGLLAIATAIQTSDRLVDAVFGRRDLLWIATFFAAVIVVCTVSVVRTRRWRGIAGLLSLSVVVGALACLGTGQSIAPADNLVAPYHAGLLGLAAAGIGLAMVVPAPKGATSEPRSALPVALLMTLSVLVSVAYGHSVAESSRDQLVEALQSRRIARAHQLASVVRAVRPRTTAMDVPVTELVPALAAEQHRLTARLEMPWPSRRTPADVGERAVILMQLDRNQEAVEILQPLTADPAQAPVALDYCGLCCQRLGDWTASRDWYQKSRRFWDEQGAGPQRTQALVSACKGIAFAERRLNHPLRAEQAYKESLAVSPSAETHFLLALLYEEQQQTKLAEQHAQTAASLAPDVYSEQSRQLCDRMALSHFRCSQVTTSGRSAAR